MLTSRDEHWGPFCQTEPGTMYLARFSVPNNFQNWYSLFQYSVLGFSRKYQNRTETFKRQCRFKFYDYASLLINEFYHFVIKIYHLLNYPNFLDKCPKNWYHYITIKKSVPLHTFDYSTFDCFGIGFETHLRHFEDILVWDWFWYTFNAFTYFRS